MLNAGPYLRVNTMRKLTNSKILICKVEDEDVFVSTMQFCAMQCNFSFYMFCTT